MYYLTRVWCYGKEAGLKIQDYDTQKSYKMLETYIFGNEKVRKTYEVIRDI